MDQYANCGTIVFKVRNLINPCSQTVRRDALVRRFNFPRASHKSKLSAVLFNEL